MNIFFWHFVGELVIEISEYLVIEGSESILMEKFFKMGVIADDGVMSGQGFCDFCNIVICGFGQHSCSSQIIRMQVCI